MELQLCPPDVAAPIILLIEICRFFFQFKKIDLKNCKLSYGRKLSGYIQCLQIWPANITA